MTRRRSLRLFRRRLASAAGVALLAVACAKVPYTNRTIGNVVPKGSLFQLGAQTYREMLQEAPIERGTEDDRRLQGVGRRIADVANRPDFAWEFSLVQDEVVNAWALPGGYIAFYTGILPMLDSEAGMAAVMGHEVGHAVAQHSGERMTAQLGVTGALALIDGIVRGSAKVNPEQRALLIGALGLGAQYGALLPFSRAHEKEADVVGMMYMAQAGYAPKQAIALWERMKANSGPQPPAFLSTHPSHQSRIDNLESWLPQARKKYQRSARVDGAAASLW